MFFRRSKAVPRSQELVFLDADDDLGTPDGAVILARSENPSASHYTVPEEVDRLCDGLEDVRELFG